MLKKQKSFARQWALAKLKNKYYSFVTCVLALVIQARPQSFV